VDKIPFELNEMRFIYFLWDDKRIYKKSFKKITYQYFVSYLWQKPKFQDEKEINEKKMKSSHLM